MLTTYPRDFDAYLIRPQKPSPLSCPVNDCLNFLAPMRGELSRTSLDVQFDRWPTNQALTPDFIQRRRALLVSSLPAALDLFLSVICSEFVSVPPNPVLYHQCRNELNKSSGRGGLFFAAVFVNSGYRAFLSRSDNRVKLRVKRQIFVMAVRHYNHSVWHIDDS
jgi:hypothetical protein